MFTLINLIFLFISLYLYMIFFMSNPDDRENIIMNKIYLFLFVFIINFISSFINYLLSSTYSFNDVIVFSVNNALVSIIAYDVYNDLVYNEYFKNYSHHQKSVILILLMIAFMTIIKLIQIIITYNF
jgi:hypothetical protein